MSSPRARDLGITVGRGVPGPSNTITDVAGVRVGHRTVIERDDGDPKAVRTGVTVIMPHEGFPWSEPVYAGTHILNGYGELIGINSIREWGILESPIVLTSSLLIGKAYDATVRWIARQDGDAGESVMPCVTECDDSWLSNVLADPIDDEDVWAALEAVTTDPVEEGCVGSGTGMQCFDFKGGIGSASRILDGDQGGFTVGVLVMTNHGDREDLLIDGVRVGERLSDLMPDDHHEGSCIVVVATDAPLLPHQLKRIATRVSLGIGRMGGKGENSSGDIFIAFSTANAHAAADTGVAHLTMIPNGRINPLFYATTQATEEAMLNAMLQAETMTGANFARVYALPVDRLMAAMKKYGR